MMKRHGKSSRLGRARPQHDWDSSGGATALSVSALIEEPNIWSDWLPASWIGPLSWVQMVGILMRATKPEQIIDTLAPTLISTRDATEAKCRRWTKDAPDEPVFLITYEEYREHFQDELLEHFAEFLEKLDGHPDLEWLGDRLHKSGAGAQSFAWFLLNGIATAQINNALNEEKVNPDARWLANIDFYEPALKAADEVVLQEFYGSFCETFARAAPPSSQLLPLRSLQCPIFDSEDTYIERLAEIEERQKRQAMREYEGPTNPVDLPKDAWRRAMRSNAWNHALDLAKVSAFGWERQLAFMLRDVSLEEVVMRAEHALLGMADVTARNAIEETTIQGDRVANIRFGRWFKWWREHFRHWNDPLRTEVERLCGPDDAGFLADWLPRFESAVFADFLIICCHAHASENRFGMSPRNERLLRSELFDVETVGPLTIIGLNEMTIKLWSRFCDKHALANSDGTLTIDFEVDERFLLGSEQPHAAIRT